MAMKKQTGSKILKVLLTAGIILLVLVLVCLFELYISVNWLSVNHFELDSDKIDNPVRMVILSDLHDHDFGEEFITKINNEHPDIIIMAGDMINKDTEKEEQIYKLIDTLNEIAPVYYGAGNHEDEYYKTRDKSVFISQIEASGGVYLDYKYLDLKINGNRIRLGGLYEYPYGTGDCNVEDATDEIKDFMTEYLNTDDYKLFIAHRPESFIFGDDSKVFDIDLVVMGHLHGGQVVIPFKGGVWGGDQGYFPRYVHGIYEKDKIHMIITSGLGTSKKKIPRFNNIPEIMVLDLH